MRRPLRARSIALAAALALAAGALAAAPAAALPTRFDVGVHDPADPQFGEEDLPGAYQAARRLGIRFVRVPVSWANVAQTRPADPTNHRSRGYQWEWLDARVRAIAANRMRPLLVLFGAPAWARQRDASGRLGLTPQAADFADFARAAGRRYDGSEAPRPRVRHWQVWNEPNLQLYLDPQDAVARYRELLNAGHSALHAVAAGNRVLAGGLAPFGFFLGDLAPLRFMRELLCMSADARPRPTCSHTVAFDVWSHHPYTTGGPNRSARARDDVSLGDLPEMGRLLRAAERAGHVSPSGRRPFWVTEFSWDTRPPDPGGVPLAVHARWVAEAFYRMWRSDVSAVVWFQLRDNYRGASGWAQTWQSGLFFRRTERYADERAKPVRAVVRFPFVALPAGRRAVVWGRTPGSRGGSVTVERRVGPGWLRVAQVRAGRHGVFLGRVAAPRGALLRARARRAASVPFRVAPTPDRRVNPFG